MLRAPCKHQGAEILVECHKHAFRVRSLGKKFLVTRIGMALGRICYIMPALPQPLHELCARAAVNEKFHPAIRTASSESLAMTAWA